MVYIHAAGDFRHIRNQMLRAACNAGDAGSAVINGFCNRFYGLHNFRHGSL